MRAGEIWSPAGLAVPGTAASNSPASSVRVWVRCATSALHAGCTLDLPQSSPDPSLSTHMDVLVVDAPEVELVPDPHGARVARHVQRPRAVEVEHVTEERRVPVEVELVT